MGATSGALIGNPQLPGIDPRAPEWLARSSEIRQTLAAGQRLHEIHNTWDRALVESAWHTEVDVLRRDLEETNRRWWRFLSSRWRDAIRKGKALFRNPAKIKAEEIIRASEAILESSSIITSFASVAPTLGTLFDGEWQSERSDWDRLRSQFEWVQSTTEAVRKGIIAPWCLDRTRCQLDRGKLKAHAAAVELAINEMQQAAAEIARILELDCAVAVQAALAELAERWQKMASRTEELGLLVSYNQAADACRSESLDAVVEIGDTWQGAGKHLNGPVRPDARCRTSGSGIPRKTCARQFRWSGTRRRRG